MSNKVPRFLDVTVDGHSSGERPRLPIDGLEGDGTALDLVKKRPSHKTAIFKQVSRRLAEMEELRAFALEKGDKVLTADGLKAILDYGDPLDT